ncbi:hypothetical protein HanIR_Chr15g0742681 [Helianthus annuus]|nr:hypothetical protein HanIR_Chr15g0742681 [Helianthus annuus]
MMFNAKAPPNLWFDAFTSATYIINRLPTKLLDDKSPFEVCSTTHPLTQTCVFLVVLFFPTLETTQKINFNQEVLRAYSLVIVLSIKVFGVLNQHRVVSTQPDMQNLMKTSSLFTKIRHQPTILTYPLPILRNTYPLILTLKHPHQQYQNPLTHPNQPHLSVMTYHPLTLSLNLPTVHFPHPYPAQQTHQAHLTPLHPAYHPSLYPQPPHPLLTQAHQTPHHPAHKAPYHPINSTNPLHLPQPQPPPTINPLTLIP